MEHFLHNLSHCDGSAQDCDVVGEHGDAHGEVIDSPLLLRSKSRQTPSGVVPRWPLAPSAHRLGET
jgi:hypothetical protein